MPARHRSLLPYLAVAAALLAAACGDNPLQPKKPADPLGPGDAVLVQCRYRAPAVPGRVREQVGGAITLDLAQPVRAITPGQSGALYDADGRLLGGGVIA